MGLFISVPRPSDSHSSKMASTIFYRYPRYCPGLRAAGRVEMKLWRRTTSSAVSISGSTGHRGPLAQDCNLSTASWTTFRGPSSAVSAKLFYAHVHDHVGTPLSGCKLARKCIILYQTYEGFWHEKNKVRKEKTFCSGKEAYTSLSFSDVVLPREVTT